MTVPADQQSQMDDISGAMAAAANAAALNDLRSRMQSARGRAEAIADITNPNRGTLTPPDWEGLAAACEAALDQPPPSLDAACWLVESQSCARGFAGLAEGAGKLAEIVGTVWEQWQPPAPRDAMRQKLKPLQTLVAEDRLPAILREIVLFDTALNAPFKFSTYLKSQGRVALQAAVAAAKREQPARVANLTAQLDAPEMIPWETVIKDAQELYGDRLTGILAGHHDDAGAAIAAWDRLDKALAGTAAGGIVALAPVRQILADIMALIAPFAAGAPHAADNTGDPAAVAAPLPVAPPGAPAGREQALAAVAAAADFFRRTEPQSPTATALDEVVRRARMSWWQLIAEMIPAKPERDSVLLRLGIQEQPAKPPP